MPRIFDNIDRELLPALRASLEAGRRADFCVGYFNLRGWRGIDDLIDRYSGAEGNRCRLLVGMQKLPQDVLREALSLDGEPIGLDKQQADCFMPRLAEEFRQQLSIGAPNHADEIALRRLARQLRARKVVVKLHLQHPPHATLIGTWKEVCSNDRR
ncbi:MAG: hypothetical protein HY066_08340 [Betaproteobacteria bacterium]|nr:hypothetical protein [Betaproteobacteria bacterium]